MNSGSINTGKPGAWLRWLLWCLYIGLAAYTRTHHAPWRDEAEPWIIARDATPADFWRYFSVAGHPPLWNLAQWPLAHALQLPIAWQGALHMAIAGGVAWLLLFRAPLPLWLAAPLVFSYQLAYQYAVIARGYALMLLLLYAALAFYPRRFRNPLSYALLLGLAFHTEIWAWPVAGLLTLYYAYDLWQKRRAGETLPRSWPRYGFALALTGLLGALALCSMWPLARENPAFHHVAASPVKFLIGLSEGFVPVNSVMEHFTAGSDIPAPFHGPLLQIVYNRSVVAVAAVFLSLLLLQWRGRALLLWAAWLGCFFYIATFVYVWFHHDAMVPLLLIWVLWFAQIEPKRRKRANRMARNGLYGLLCGCFLFSDFMNGVSIAYERKSDYSAGFATAQFLRAQAQPDRPLIALGCDAALAATAYLSDYPLFLAGQARFGSYYTRDASRQTCIDTPYDAQLAQAEAAIRDHRGLFVISDERLKAPEKRRLLPVYQKDGFKESFWVYWYR